MHVARALIRMVGCTVRRGSKTVLRELDLRINESEVVCIVGDNGSGKSTLLETLAGLHPLREGEIMGPALDGKDIVVADSKGRRTALPGLSIALQSDGACLDETVIGRLKMATLVAGTEANDEEIKQIMAEWSILHRSGDRLATLSNGLRRRVSVLSALIPALKSEKKGLVMLDEPSEGMDETSQKLLRYAIENLRSLGHTVVIATHDQSLMNVADRLIRIQDQTIFVTGEPPESDFGGIPIRRHNNDRVSEFCRWGISLEWKNPIDTIHRLVPSIIAILLIGSVGADFVASDGLFSVSFCLLLPAFISAMVRPALIDRLNEGRSGDWWRAHMGRSMRPAASVVGSSWLLPLPLTYLTFVIISIGTLDVDPDAKFWIWLPALAIIDISVAATGIHLLVASLRRRGAVAASLMMAIMVWPFLMLVDATSLILQDGMSVNLGFDTPLGLIITSSIISACIWASSVLIPSD